MFMKKIIVAITGASGVIYAIDLLKKLKEDSSIEVHLVMSQWAKKNLELEAQMGIKELSSLADEVHNNNNLGASIASGSFMTDGMVIIPASMKTVAEVANGLGSSLITRAADVIIKEQRKLIVVPRETPLSPIHLQNLLALANLGCHIIPPIPAFYNKPITIQDLVEHQTMKVLDSLNVKSETGRRWGVSDVEK